MALATRSSYNPRAACARRSADWFFAFIRRAIYLEADPNVKRGKTLDMGDWRLEMSHNIPPELRGGHPDCGRGPGNKVGRRKAGRSIPGTRTRGRHPRGRRPARRVSDLQPSPHRVTGGAWKGQGRPSVVGDGDSGARSRFLRHKESLLMLVCLSTAEFSSNAGSLI